MVSEIPQRPQRSRDVDGWVEAYFDGHEVRIQSWVRSFADVDRVRRLIEQELARSFGEDAIHQSNPESPAHVLHVHVDVEGNVGSGWGPLHVAPELLVGLGSLIDALDTHVARSSSFPQEVGATALG